MKQLPWDASLAEAAPGTLRELPLPPVQDPLTEPPFGIRKLEVSADGRRLLLAREGGEPNDYTLLDLGSGRSVWSYRDPCCAGSPPSWAVRPSPTQDRALLLAFDPPVQLLDEAGVRELPDIGADARWSGDGTWIGGSGGALLADGTPLSGPPLEGEVDLVLPGAQPGVLRLLSEELLYTWDGRSPPRSEGIWLGEQSPDAHRLREQGDYPVTFSPTGDFVTWHEMASPERTSLCALATGEEWPLPDFVKAAAWSDPRSLWLLVADGVLPAEIEQVRLVRMDPVTRQTEERALPADWLPTALAASTQPPALFIGGADGRVFRLDLP